MISQLPLSKVDSQIAELIQAETARKEFSLELIASENCVSEAVLEAVGSILTDKYAEGYPGRRYYGGCEYYDEIEDLARNRAKQLFGAKFANVQPHSGANANLAVYFAFIKPGDTVLAPRLDHGGHLTHGSPVNFSGKMYNIIPYGLNPKTSLWDHDEVKRLAHEHKPKMIVCGASAYPRQIDWQFFGDLGREVGAVTMADVAHYAGLIVGGVYDNPTACIDIVTTTTHKTLRGPRGGLILTNNKDYSKEINKAVFPGIQGGPLMHQIAGKAVAFGEALTDDFKVYARAVVDNAQALAKGLVDHGFSLQTGGTDSHKMVLDLRSQELTGAEVEEALGKVGITVNKNAVPDDPQPPKVTSGIRVGTAALTSRGFDTSDMQVVARLIAEAVEHRANDTKLAELREEVRALCRTRPLFPYRLKQE